MPEFCDAIPNHELKEELAWSNKHVLLCLLAETGQYAVQLIFKEKKKDLYFRNRRLCGEIEHL